MPITVLDTMMRCLRNVPREAGSRPGRGFDDPERGALRRGGRFGRADWGWPSPATGTLGVLEKHASW